MMEKFLFINIIFSTLNIFLLVYAYSLNFFSKSWRKKVNQDTLVGLALIFLTMATGFLLALIFLTMATGFYFYFVLIS